jgi:hypothetical protein
MAGVTDEFTLPGAPFSVRVHVRFAFQVEGSRFEPEPEHEPRTENPEV